MSEKSSITMPYQLPQEHPLQTEWTAFCRELPQLLADGNEGRFALVQGDKVVSIWDSRRAAVEAGYERFGLTKFMVHLIQRIEQPIRIGAMS
jgi:hypothetical protein